MAVSERYLSLSPACGLTPGAIFHSLCGPDPLAAGGVGCGPALHTGFAWEQSQAHHSETVILTHVKC